MIPWYYPGNSWFLVEFEGQMQNPILIPRVACGLLRHCPPVPNAVPPPSPLPLRISSGGPPAGVITIAIQRAVPKQRRGGSSNTAGRGTGANIAIGAWGMGSGHSHTKRQPAHSPGPPRFRWNMRRNGSGILPYHCHIYPHQTLLPVAPYAVPNNRMRRCGGCAVARKMVLSAANRHVVL